MMILAKLPKIRSVSRIVEIKIRNHNRWIDMLQYLVFCIRMMRTIPRRVFIKLGQFFDIVHRSVLHSKLDLSTPQNTTRDGILGVTCFDYLFF